MSTTTSIYCKTCKKYMWYGQTGWVDGERAYYTYKTDKVEPLACFLVEHRGHELVSCINDDIDFDDEGYEEVNYRDYLPK